MAAASRSTRTQRVDLRLPAVEKETIERAAVLTGQTLTQFARRAMIHRARQVIRESETIVISERARARLLTALDDADVKPNAALLRAAELDRATMG